ncbi:hypothetical protein HYW99_03985 [Candidatus Woesearchaeota archaeon]|nr:hypothetical protein [Candidatus Woesearchaeota archaeon]
MVQKFLHLECKQCSYRFKKQKIPFKCPYCAVEGSVSFVKTAQDLLDEALV